MNAARLIRVGFLILALLLIFIGFVAYQSARQLALASQDVAATNELVKNLENFLSRLKDTQVAQREYILTGDESYVRQIEEARADVEAQLEQIVGYRADRHWQELLRTLVPEKFSEIQRTIHLRRSGDLQAASHVILTNRGSQAMDDIGRVVRAMIAEENTRLKARSQDQDASFKTTMKVFGFTLALNLVLILCLFHLTQREQQSGKRLTGELEKRVAERTEELQRSNDDLQQFAYIASHDLKEPMRAISSYATLLERRYGGKLDENASTYIRFVVDGVKRMNALIDDLLMYSRAGASPDAPLESVNTEEVLASVLADLRQLIADSRAQVTHDPLPPVTCDPVRLAQVLQNLIANAIKYRGDRAPMVRVTADVQENETVFAVEDNGIGIPAKHHASIFRVFHRLHGRDVEGTGIGLATCKRIVEQGGGTIWVESLSGSGSTFRFSVPHREPAQQKASAASS